LHRARVLFDLFLELDLRLVRSLLARFELAELLVPKREHRIVGQRRIGFHRVAEREPLAHVIVDPLIAFGDAYERTRAPSPGQDVLWLLAQQLIEYIERTMRLAIRQHAERIRALVFAPLFGAKLVGVALDDALRQRRALIDDVVDHGLVARSERDTADLESIA